ncbi:hypothetical protein MMC08_008758 [Hypocenomyce scalaris]|nr:hypothetical protein [Hypocenomyce scalaris]
MNATFLSTHPPSVFRQDPSPEVDAAWNRIANTNTILVNTAEVERMGFDSSKTARYNADFNLGPDAHIGRIDMFHQIHCLNELRKEVNFDYYFGEKWPDHRPSALHRTHSSHCIYLLLQNIMCNSNVDIYMHYWIDTQNLPFPDFSINHQCRDFEAVLKWQEEHSVPLRYYMEHIKKPEDVFSRNMSQEYKQVTGYDPVTGLSNGHSG